MKVGTDVIASITAMPVAHLILDKLYVKTFNTDSIVFIGKMWLIWSLPNQVAYYNWRIQQKERHGKVLVLTDSFKYNLYIILCSTFSSIIVGLFGLWPVIISHITFVLSWSL